METSVLSNFLFFFFFFGSFAEGEAGYVQRSAVLGKAKISFKCKLKRLTFTASDSQVRNFSWIIFI